jgi:hypothetical protein
LSVFFQLRDYFVKFNHGPGQQNGDDGDDDQQLDQSESPPGLAEIKIREDFFANRFAAFKHRLAHAAGKIRTILRLAREPVKGCRRKRFLTNCRRWQALPAKVVNIFHTIHKTATQR